MARVAGLVDVVIATVWEDRRHEACLRRQSPLLRAAGPAWCREEGQALQGDVFGSEIPGVPPSSHHLAATGVPTVPRAEDRVLRVALSCLSPTLASASHGGHAPETDSCFKERSEDRFGTLT